MPMINMDEAVSLDHLMQKAIRTKLGLPEKYAYRVFAAYNVTSMVAAMHKCGHYIVDLKPSNVSVYKDTMMVAMVDCDGFSIKGENDNRYPAEFVSEEYIYPEGMDLGCDEMGEEQDKFALAVMIFKLLNNGIHPFSGVPRKNDGEMLTIQNRIEEYHYAYGLWPDSYQAPHPYSIHEYFDKKTLELFERAFVKGLERPSAKEWQEHLWTLMHNLKPCKKNPNHVYFTSKGCGLCAAEERFRGTLKDIKNRRKHRRWCGEWKSPPCRWNIWKRQSGETAPKPPPEPNCRGRNCSLSAVFRFSLSDAAAFGGRYSSGGARAAGDYDHVCHARHKQRAAFAAAEISAAAKQGHHPNAAGLCLYLHYYRAGLLEPPSRRII